MSGRWRAVLFAVVVVSISIRLVAIGVDGEYEPQHDAFDYDRHARSIAAGEGFPESIYVPERGATAIRAPAYPYALGVVYALSGDSTTAGRVLGVLLGGCTVALLFMLTARIWGNEVGLIAAGLAAIFPPLIALGTELYSENLFIPLLLAAALCVLRCRETGATAWAAAAGVTLGVAALSRGPGVVGLIPVLIGLWFIRPRRSLRSLALPLVGLACAVVTVLPWTVRNYAELEALVPVTTSTGYGLAGTYNPESEHASEFRGGWRNPVIVPGYRQLFERQDFDEADLDTALRERSLDFAADHPLYVLAVSAGNLLRLTYLEGGSVVDHEGEVVDAGIGSDRRALDRAALWIAAAFAVVGVVAIALSRRRRHPRGATRMSPMIPAGPLYMWLIPLALVLVAAPVAGLPRYRLPADPFLLILAAIGVAAVVDRVAFWLTRRRSAG